MSTYSKYCVHIPFNGSIEITENNYPEAKTYFYRACEVIRFNENKKRIEPNTQHLISEERPPDFLSFDLSEFGKDDSLHLEHISQETAMSEPESSSPCSSLSNSFSYYNYLSSLFILPNLSKKKIKEEIQDYVNRHEPFQIVTPLQEMKIEDKRVLKWRVQSGKTRLDHYLVFGKGYNYLFVSSPYGTNGGIETVISEMHLLKKE